MLDLICIIAKFLDPVVQGIPVHAYFGSLTDFLLEHPVGAVLLKIEDGRLTVDLIFQESSIRCAGDYLKMIEDALMNGITLENGETLTFTFEKNTYLFNDPLNHLDYHSSTYLISQPKPEALELKAQYREEGD
jgi:hypothetical protein